jgi:hypothetical protein
MAVKREECTIWWIDDHWGRGPATLGSCVGERTAKLVYIDGRQSPAAVGYRSQIPVDSAFFTAEDAVNAALSRARADRLRYEGLMHAAADKIQQLIELKEGLNAGQQ